MPARARALTLALNRKIITEGILQDATLPQLYGWVPYGIKDVVDPTQGLARRRRQCV